MIWATAHPTRRTTRRAIRRLRDTREHCPAVLMGHRCLSHDSHSQRLVVIIISRCWSRFLKRNTNRCFDRPLSPNWLASIRRKSVAFTRPAFTYLHGRESSTRPTSMCLHRNSAEIVTFARDRHRPRRWWLILEQPPRTMADRMRRISCHASIRMIHRSFDRQSNGIAILWDCRRFECETSHAAKADPRRNVDRRKK